jgi:hypothetical protein
MLAIVLFLTFLNVIVIGCVGSLAIWSREDEVRHWNALDARRAADAIRARRI